MNKLVLRFNTGGRCQLCGKRRETTDEPTLLKRTVQLISQDCFILMNICFACLFQNTIEAIKENCIIDKEFIMLKGHKLLIEIEKEEEF